MKEGEAARGFNQTLGHTIYDVALRTFKGDAVRARKHVEAACVVLIKQTLDMALSGAREMLRELKGPNYQRRQELLKQIEAFKKEMKGVAKELRGLSLPDLEMVAAGVCADYPFLPLLMQFEEGEWVKPYVMDQVKEMVASGACLDRFRSVEEDGGDKGSGSGLDFVPI